MILLYTNTSKSPTKHMLNYIDKNAQQHQRHTNNNSKQRNNNTHIHIITTQTLTNKHSTAHT